MPAFLSRRKPHQQKFLRVPQSVRICTCDLCSIYRTWNPLTNEPVDGQILGKKQWTEHQRLQRKRADPTEVQNEPAKIAEPSSERRKVRPRRSDSRLGKTKAQSRSRRVVQSNTIPASHSHGVKASSKVGAGGRRSEARDEGAGTSDEDGADIQALENIEQSLLERSLQFPTPPPGLVFVNQPRKGRVSPLTPSGEINSGCYALRYNEGVNSPLLQHELWLMEALTTVDSVLTQGRAHGQSIRNQKKVVTAAIGAEVDRVERMKADEWHRQEALGDLDPKGSSGVLGAIQTAPYLLQPFLDWDPISTVVYITVAVLHLLCHLSLDHCAFTLKSLQLILTLALSLVAPLNAETKAILSSIPDDARTVLGGLDLKPRTIAYICCPRCFHCYSLDGDPYPDRCTHRDTPDSKVCNRALRKTQFVRGAMRTYPSRRYLYNNMKEWMGRLACRAGFEEHLDRDLTTLKNGPDGVHKDIWDARILRDFLGPDELPFMQRNGNEGRYIFSLCVDGFNPYSMKEAGKKVSSTGIYMVCLNLPPHLRYLMENIFLVGIIPGPGEPSLHQINHCLRPLVDDLQAFWDPGVFFDRTFRHKAGRLIRCALVPLVCDLPAARQVSGFASYASRNFCSFCRLQSDDMDNLDVDNWPVRTYEEHYARAKEWRDAPSEAVRQQLFDQHGVRWSELLRLSYWDPTRFMVVDTMHALLLGNLKRHCRDIWGMNVNFADGDVYNPAIKTSSEPTELEMQNAHHVLRFGSNTELGQLGKRILWRLCTELQALQYGVRSKKHLLRNLFTHRAALNWPEGKVDKGKQKADGSVPNDDIQAAERILGELNVKKLERVKKPVLLALCTKIMGLDSANKAEELKELRSMTKSVLATKLVSLRANENPSVHNVVQTVKRKTKTAVLGRETLHEVWRDMDITRSPSWLARAPNQLGSSRHGKLSADQWRTACTVNLVVTLVRIWGPKPKESWEHKYLLNFMNLITATKIGTMRSMTPKRIQQYGSHMHQYLLKLASLYPHNNGISPNQHVSLHLPKIFQNFGPSHAWRCFPFERYNYLLQNVDTNMKFGEMEQTMLEKFCMAQNIRALITGAGIPAALNKLKSAFIQVFQSDTRGTLLQDMLAFEDEQSIKPARISNPRPLSDTVCTLLQHRFDAKRSAQQGTGYGGILGYQGVTQGSAYRRGVKFTTASSSINDSFVVYGRTSDTEWLAGQIEEIFLHESRQNDGSYTTETLFVVRQYKPLSVMDATHDHYRQFPIAGGRLYYDEFQPNPTLISMDDILCHFACTPYSSEAIVPNCIHALPLDRD